MHHENKCDCESCNSDLDDMDMMLMVLEKYSSTYCPECNSENITKKHLDTSRPFARKLVNSEHRFICNDCKGQW